MSVARKGTDPQVGAAEAPDDVALAEQLANDIIAAGPEPNVARGLLTTCIALAEELAALLTHDRQLFESEAAIKTLIRDRRGIAARRAAAEQQFARTLAFLKDVETRVSST